VKQDDKEPVSIPGDSPSEGEQAVGGISADVSLVNEALIEASAKLIGKTIELITRIPEMDFTEFEIEQLKSLWSPLMPTINPVVAALVGTLVIVGGKTAIYFSLKSGKKGKDELQESRSPVFESPS